MQHPHLGESISIFPHLLNSSGKRFSARLRPTLTATLNAAYDDLYLLKSQLLTEYLDDWAHISDAEGPDFHATHVAAYDTAPLR